METDIRGGGAGLSYEQKVLEFFDSGWDDTGERVKTDDRREL